MTAVSTAVDQVVVLGIRHHGPGSARSVWAELDRVQPGMVLIEGPADADPLLALTAAERMQPPVALLGYVNDDPKRAAFWPYAVFSPEWQALRWASAHDVPVRFCDLPTGLVLARPAHHGEAEAAPDEPEYVVRIRQDPIGVLADAAGYDDAERWWDDVIEGRLEGDSPFTELTEAMAELRAHLPVRSEAEQLHEEQREAFMRQTLRVACKETEGRVAVVCGAWHAPALSGKLPPAAADARLLKGIEKCRTTLAWIPWTHSRLAQASGYGAGVPSPGWYHHLFTAPDRPVTRWLTRVAGVLRNHDLPVSSAHIIESVRLAETLATLRGRPLAGLAEVNEATRSVMCDGDEVALAFVTAELVVGEQLGTVPEDAPLVPLESDLRALARTLRLKIDPLSKSLSLDLRKDTDRARSSLLHRLTALGIGWGVPADDEVRSTGTFRETWTLRWQPELSLAIIDAAPWGTTVRDAAAHRLTDRARTAETLDVVTRAVETTLLAELPDILPAVLAALDAKAAVDTDVTHLMAALPALVRAVRYGDVRGTDTGSLGAVISALTIRISAGLPGAVTSLSDESAEALKRVLDGTQSALALYGQDETGRPTLDRWLSALTAISRRDDVHGLIGGRIVRILLDVGRLDRSAAAIRFQAELSVGGAAPDKAAWVEGFLAGGGVLLVHDRELLTVLDDWLAELAETDFIDVLPLLRRTFGTYSQPERSNIGDAARRLTGAGSNRPAAAEELDVERAAAVLRTVAGLLQGAR